MLSLSSFSPGVFFLNTVLCFMLQETPCPEEEDENAVAKLNPLDEDVTKLDVNI